MRIGIASCAVSLVLSAILGCHSTTRTHSSSNIGAAQEPGSVQLQVIDSTNLIASYGRSGITTVARIVVRDSSTWRQVWRRVTERFTPAPTLPRVDFDSNMVLLAAAGQMQAGDYIRVDFVGIVGSRMYSVVRTGGGCFPVEQSRYPVDIVRVPRVEGEVVFLEYRAGAISCLPYEQAPSPRP